MKGLSCVSGPPRTRAFLSLNFKGSASSYPPLIIPPRRTLMQRRTALPYCCTRVLTTPPALIPRTRSGLRSRTRSSGAVSLCSLTRLTKASPQGTLNMMRSRSGFSSEMDTYSRSHSRMPKTLVSTVPPQNEFLPRRRLTLSEDTDPCLPTS